MPEAWEATLLAGAAQIVSVTPCHRHWRKSPESESMGGIYTFIRTHPSLTIKENKSWGPLEWEGSVSDHV